MSGDIWCNCGACLTIEEIDMNRCGCCGARFRLTRVYRRKKIKSLPLLDRKRAEGRNG